MDEFQFLFQHGFNTCSPKIPPHIKNDVSGLFVEFEVTVYHIYDIILNTVTMRT